MARKIVEVELKAVGADKAVQEINEVTQSLNQLEKQEQKNTKETESLTDSVTTNGGAMGILNELTGGMAQRFKDSYEALALTNKGLKGMKGALLATGIGAAVIAIGALVANFREVKIFLGFINPEMEKLNETMKEGEVAAIDASRGMETLTSVITDLTQSEEVRNQALQELGKTVDGISDLNLDQAGSLDKIVSMTAPYVKAVQARAKADAFAKIIAEEQAGILRERARIETDHQERLDRRPDDLDYHRKANIFYEKELANFTENSAFLDTLNDQYKTLITEALSAEAAITSNSKKRKTSTKDATNEIQEMATALEAIRVGQIDTEDERREEERNKIEKEYAKLLELAVKYYGEDSEQAVQLEIAKKTKLDELQAGFDLEDDEKNKIKDEKIKKRIEDLQAFRDGFKQKVQDEEDESEAQKLERQRQREIKAVDELGGTLADKVAINAFYNKKIEKANEEAADADIEMTKKKEDEKQKQIQGAAADIIGIVGASSKFGKGIAIASAIQDTYAGANKAFKQGGTFGFISAAAIIAAGLRNVQKIVATKTPKAPVGIQARDTGSEPTISIPSSATAAPSLPPEFSTVGASGVNQLADALGGQSPVRAFVVSGDVSTAQQLDRNIIQSASLG